MTARSATGDGRSDAFVTDVLPPLAFGVLLRALRLRAGLSVPKLAEATSVSRHHIEHLEIGWAQLRRRHLTVRPSREMVATLAAGLGLDGVDTARLLIAAGYWPWRMPDAFVVAFVEAVEAASAVDDARADGPPGNGVGSSATIRVVEREGVAP